MAKRHVYSKDSSGFGDFVYVDLLPEVKRSRQFNMNVILALLFAVVLGFFLIYRPYSARVFEIEELTSENFDLRHELTLTNEEFAGYGIDLDAITFIEDIENAELLRINFNNLIDDIELKVNLNNGRIRSIAYNAETSEIQVQVSIISQFSFNTLNTQILNEDWVFDSTYTTPTRLSDDVEYTSTFVIGVDYHVE
jgi:hypothetical protein